MSSLEVNCNYINPFFITNLFLAIKHFVGRNKNEKISMHEILHQFKGGLNDTGWQTKF